MSDDLVYDLEGMDWDDIRDRPSKAAVLMEDAAAEITRLRAELATARREGMEEARAIFNDAIENTTLEGTLLMRQIDAAIRAAAKEGKP